MEDTSQVKIITDTSPESMQNKLNKYLKKELFEDFGCRVRVRGIKLTEWKGLMMAVVTVTTPTKEVE